MDVAGKPIELRDEQRCTLPFADNQRLVEPRTVTPCSALLLREALDDATALPRGEGFDGLSLRIQSEAGDALALGRNAVVGDVVSNDDLL